MSVYTRYQYQGAVRFGILDEDRMAELRGGLFPVV
jgi:hypothetical protein